LWARRREIDANVDTYAALRSSETEVVILEPRPAPVPWPCRSGPVWVQRRSGQTPSLRRTVGEAAPAPPVGDDPSW